MKNPALTQPGKQKRNLSPKKILKSLGIIGFLFFLIKGILWLFVFFGIGWLTR